MVLFSKLKANRGDPDRTLKDSSITDRNDCDFVNLPSPGLKVVLLRTILIFRKYTFRMKRTLNG